MDFDYTAFQVTYGRDVPSPLRALYENGRLLEEAPVRFAFPDKPCVVEIQYFRAINDLDEQDVERARFAFAVDTDGFDMLVDLVGDGLPILKREYGDVDQIGVTLVELLCASCSRLNDGGHHSIIQ